MTVGDGDTLIWLVFGGLVLWSVQMLVIGAYDKWKTKREEKRVDNNLELLQEEIRKSREKIFQMRRGEAGE